MSSHLLSTCTAKVAFATLREQRGLKRGDSAGAVWSSQNPPPVLKEGGLCDEPRATAQGECELGASPTFALHRADSIEKQLNAQGVQVLPDKPYNAAAALVGLGLLYGADSLELATQGV